MNLHTFARRAVLGTISLLLPVGLVLAADAAHGADASHTADAPHAATVPKAAEAPPVSTAKEMGDKVREALGTNKASKPKQLTLVINGKAVATAAPVGGHSAPAVTPQSSRAALAARAAAALAAKSRATPHAGEVHWDYDGPNGPQAWAQLKPEFSLCGIGKRQSPISIEDSNSLVGPAEPIQFNYTPSNATVVNNGHTIQVDVQGENSILVRGSTYRLLQFHFHTPSEEQVNGKRFSMVAHLVHKNDAGQLAVVAVLMDLGEMNPLIDKVWTYMPLDKGDKVTMPRDMLNLNELLPGDQRYFQFLGSLTTPPCSEDVLWLVLKEPVKVAKAQHRLFSQIYPHNARPLQAVNDRPIRNAQ
jgi:carbonic anhydrase